MGWPIFEHPLRIRESCVVDRRSQKTVHVPLEPIRRVCRDWQLAERYLKRLKASELGGL
jgi:hypothetical protein